MRIQMKIEDSERWAEVKEGGYRRWVIRQGVLGFGFPLMGFIVVLLLLISPEGPVRSWWVVAPTIIVLAVLAGWGVADRIWGDAQKRFE